MEDVDHLFQKRFSFQKCNNWELPPLSAVFKEKIWKIDHLARFKLELNATKSLLNDKGCDWQKHTANINKSSLVLCTVKGILRSELVTQAWCKFYEILSSFHLIYFEEKFVSLHLCEAPGAFISALNYYLFWKHSDILWQWYANTLNPYYEGHSIKAVVVDDRLVLPTLQNWIFGKDNTGDIMEPDFYDDNYFKENELANLVTADGSINCLHDPGEQEIIVSKLHLSEVINALKNLAPLGSFVLKKFTFFECTTICEIYLLNCLFDKVHVYKPVSSKAGNSEVYVICIGYIGLEKALPYLDRLREFNLIESYAIFPKIMVPESFISQLIECSELFMNWQKVSIEENISLYNKMTPEKISWINTCQKNCLKLYLKKYHISSIDNLPYPKLWRNRRKCTTAVYGFHDKNLKILTSQVFGETYENIEKEKTLSWKELLLDIENRLKICFLSDQENKMKLEWLSTKKNIFSILNYINYDTWITTGRKIDFIQNSKFCNPLILYLWNKIIYNPKFQINNHISQLYNHWKFSEIIKMLKKTELSRDFCLVSLSFPYIVQNDCVLTYLCKEFDEPIQTYKITIGNKQENTIPQKQRLYFINTTIWNETTLNQELLIKKELVQVLIYLLEVIKQNDIVIIYIQSILTRFTIGLFFMILSLFDKFLIALPNQNAPATFGQLWVFSNYQRQIWTDKILELLMQIKLKLHQPCISEVLEVVPMKTLCYMPYYDSLLATNNAYLLQKLYSLIRIEKASNEI